MSPPALYADLYPFAGHRHRVEHGELHYLDEGPRDRAPLLMLHGNPTWSFYFRDLIRAFRGEHRVVAVDHMGCGLSDKPSDGFDYRLESHIKNLEELVLALDLRDITLVLHDWGGAIGMGFAVRHPDRVRRLVVFNTAAFPSTRMPASLHLARIPGFGAVAIRGLNAFAKTALRLCVQHQERLTPAVRAGYLAPYDNWRNRIATLRFVQDIPMGPSHPSWPTLADIERRVGVFADRPMLILWGARDFVFEDSFLEEWKRRFPKAEVHRFEDAGHYVIEDAHERIVPLARSFLERTS